MRDREGFPTYACSLSNRVPEQPVIGEMRAEEVGLHQRHRRATREPGGGPQSEGVHLYV